MSDGTFVKVYKLKMAHVYLSETDHPILSGARLISLTCEFDDKRIMPTAVLEMTPWDYNKLLQLIQKH